MATRKYKVFALAGQSNASGNNAGGAPAVVNGYQLATSSTQSSLLSRDQSCAHAFANTFYNGQTTHTPVIILRAASGVSVTTNTATNWSSSGTLRGLLKTDLDNTKTVYGKSDVDGCIWIQGEADAELIRAATITRAQFKTAMQDVLDWWELNYPTAPFYFVRTGFDTVIGQVQSWIDVQEVQQELCDENPSFVFMAYTGTSNFQSLGYMFDNVHYTQSGQNVIGEAVANFIL
jgi:hypothetical protein